MSGKILLTGSQGFIGSKLLLTLKSQGYEVHGLELELTNPNSVTQAVRLAASGPVDAVIHLAAMSHVPTCEKEPEKAFSVNRDGTAHLVEAMKQFCPQSHFILASSAQVYAAPSGAEILDGVVFSESRKIAPQNVYAQGKWEAEQLLKRASDEWGLKAKVLRLFNYTHKSQGTEFFLPYLYSMLSKAAPGEKNRIPVGNLDIYRDIGVLVDLLSAFSCILAHPPAGDSCQVYNVCGGVRRHLGKLARKLADRVHPEAEFYLDPARVRPGEPKSVCGSHEKFTRATGWRPSHREDDDFLTSFLDDSPILSSG